MNKKYEINSNDRVVALRDFGNVKAGDVGGFVESENNLSHDGDCWVTGNARVFDNALVFGNAWVSGNAQVFDDALVYGNARVSGNAQVFDDALVFGNAWVTGNAQVFDDVRVRDDDVFTK